MEQLLDKIPLSHGLQTLIGIAAIIIATALAAVLLRWFLFSLVARLTRRTSTTLDERLLAATRGYFRLLVALFGISVLFNFIQTRYQDFLGPQLFDVLDGVIYALGVIVVAILIMRVIATGLNWYSQTVARRTDTTLDDEFVPLIDRAVKIIMFMLALLIILDNFGVDIKGLVAVLGVGSLAVALAAQETLANMIGGFTIMIDRPFRKGDMVRLPDGRRVRVHEIGIRSTKFLTYDNTLVIVPNSELIKATVHNITYPAPRVRVVIDVGVSYGSDMSLVREVMLDEASKHDTVLKDPAPQFFFLNFGDSSLDVSMRCHIVRAEDYRRVASDLRTQILNRFRAEGIEIPFPQRVVTMVKEPESGGE